MDDKILKDPFISTSDIAATKVYSIGSTKAKQKREFL